MEPSEATRPKRVKNQHFEAFFHIKKRIPWRITSPKNKHMCLYASRSVRPKHRLTQGSNSAIPWCKQLFCQLIRSAASQAPNASAFLILHQITVRPARCWKDLSQTRNALPLLDKRPRSMQAANTAGMLELGPRIGWSAWFGSPSLSADHSNHCITLNHILYSICNTKYLLPRPTAPRAEGSCPSVLIRTIPCFFKARQPIWRVTS